MTSLLYTTAYPYALKKPAGPFYCLRVRSMGCLDIDGIIARIARLPFVIPPEEYAYLVNTFLNECIAATAVPVLDTGPPGKRDPPPHAKLINAV